MLCRDRRAWAIAVLLGLHLASAPQLPGADAPYRVIVHPSVKGNQIPRSALSAIFLKEARKWGDGSAVLPVDQSLRSPVRNAFCQEVLQQDVQALSFYWQRRIASGVAPPMVKSSDEEVISFVSSTAGAIGYVSAATSLPTNVKAVAVGE
jgi:ABC-type phosphate transport system substrate-binding protein